jgi:hypothetical protein
MPTITECFEAERAFDPDTIEILVTALEAAWTTLQASGAPFSEQRYADSARDVLAKHIIGIAHQGERDPRKLADDALLALAQTNLRAHR